jgi:hypothetical protein
MSLRLRLISLIAIVRLIRVVPATSRVPITLADRSYESVVIETDPHNEIVEVWNKLSGSLITLAWFCSLTTLLIYLFIGRALQPLDRLAAALEQVGHVVVLRPHAGRGIIKVRGRFRRFALGRPSVVNIVIDLPAGFLRARGRQFRRERRGGLRIT